MKTLARRTFLQNLAATTCGSCVHSALSPLMGGSGYMAWASPAPAPAQSILGPEPLLILINLDGGCSYNITPIYTGAFRDLNRQISFGPENSIPLTADQGLHSTLTGLLPVWQQGNLAILNLVGLVDPVGLTRSHADGADIKLTGIINIKEVKSGVTPGWVVRLSSHFGEPFSGVAIGSGRSSITVGGTNPPLSITSLDELGEQVLIREEVGEWMRLTRTAVMEANASTASPAQNMIRNTMKNVDSTFERLRVESQVTLPTIAHPFDLTSDPQGFVRSCRDAARLLTARSLRVRFLYLEHRGFDTHGEEKNTLTRLLMELNSGLTPLIETIKANGRWNDTVIATLTEFGRTHENGTGGSDHGASTSMFVMGGRVKGGQKSPVPTANQIKANDYFLDVHYDFRHVFREIVAAMGLNPDAIFPYPIAPRSLGLF